MQQFQQEQKRIQERIAQEKQQLQKNLKWNDSPLGGMAAVLETVQDLTQMIGQRETSLFMANSTVPHWRYREARVLRAILLEKELMMLDLAVELQLTTVQVKLHILLATIISTVMVRTGMVQMEKATVSLMLVKTLLQSYNSKRRFKMEKDVINELLAYYRSGQPPLFTPDLSS